MKNIILLNGPSIENSNPEINFVSDRIFVINRKKQIEKKINHFVDYWCVFSPSEAIDMVEDIYRFLNRPEENRFITTGWTLYHIREYLEIRPFPNSNRIILFDETCAKIHNVTTVKNADGRWNSISVLLYTLAIIDKKIPTFIYGMDGVKDNDQKEIYYNQRHLSKERLNGSNIYNDMIFFDNNFWEFMKKQNLHPKIFNMNTDSFYKSLPFSEKCCEAKYNAPKFFLHNEYSNKELLEKAKNFLLIQ